MASAGYSLAGLTTEGGELDRPLDAGSWVAPDHIELDGHLLRWSGRARESASRPGLLESFVRLDDAAAVVEFAREFGPLRWPADRDGLPVLTFAEDVQTWLGLSSTARGVLDLAQHLRLREPVPSSVWDTLAALDPKPKGRYVGVRLDPVGPLRWPFAVALVEPEQLVSLVLSAWLAGVRVSMVWHARRPPEFRHQPGSVFGAVGLALSLAVSSVGGFAVCSECGRPYVPRRRPAAGRRRFCDPCRDVRAPQRAAEAAYRARRRAGVE